jgi:SAM-dependent methyltransferase
MTKEKEVAHIYDKIIHWFDTHRTKDLSLEEKYLAIIEPYLPKQGTILDVGCGTAEPLAAYFIEKGHELTGLDASKKMIALCKERYPKQEWILGDMRTLKLDKTFDVVIAWHSFFHLPHEAHADTLKLLASHLKPHGLLIFTTGAEKGELWSENGGEQLFHASLAPIEYEHILLDNHLTVILHDLKDPDCGGATVWIAKSKD